MLPMMTALAMVAALANACDSRDEDPDEAVSVDAAAQVERDPQLSPGPQASDAENGDAFEPVNMPADFERLAETSFDAAGLDGFVHRAATIVADSTPPVSCCRVGEKRYAVGDDGGRGVAVHHDVGAHEIRSVYVAAWVKLSQNFRNHRSGMTKLFYAWTGGHPKMILSVYGDRLELRSLLRYAPGAGGYEVPNRAPRPRAHLRRGQWHLVEYIVGSSSAPGRPDGVMRWWLDGTLVGEYDRLVTHGPDESLDWEQVEWNSIWGGTGDVVSAADGDMHMRVAHLYIGGKRAPERDRSR